QLADELRIERTAGETQLQERPGSVGLCLRGEDPARGAGGLGAGNAALEKGATRSGLLEPPGYRASDDACSADQDLHQGRSPGRCSPGAMGRTGMGGCGCCGPLTDGAGRGLRWWVIHQRRANTTSASTIRRMVRSGKRRGPPEPVDGVVRIGRIDTM